MALPFSAKIWRMAMTGCYSTTDWDSHGPAFDPSDGGTSGAEGPLPKPHKESLRAHSPARAQHGPYYARITAFESSVEASRPAENLARFPELPS
jgi:hypothetical protein